jgi:hypothetical protein
MALMRFSLDRISAFKNKDQNASTRDFCIGCAREAKDEYTLIPFLNDQLGPVLADFGNGMGAIMLCDKCGEVIATYYPEALWKDHSPGQDVQAGQDSSRRSLLNRQF